jgi:hypothetical protein
MAQGSTMFTVGTLLRHAEEANAPVRVLVDNTWIEGRVIGADGLGVVLDNGQGQQALVRLESIVAVMFSQTDIEPGSADPDAPREGRRRAKEPIEAGPVGGSWD